MKSVWESGWRMFHPFFVAGFLFIVATGNGRSASPEIVKGEVRIAHITGSIEIIRGGAAIGVTTQTTNQPPLAPGDRIRTGPNSGVSLSDGTKVVATIGALTDIEVRPPDSPSAGFVINLWKGVLYFFHRGEPGRARIITRGAPAGIEGTEVVVEVAEVNGKEQTTISVIDGLVRFGEGADALTLKNGEAAIARVGEAPQRAPGFVVKNILQWAFYYPAVIDLRDLALTAEEQEALRESLAAYRAGDLPAAIAQYPAQRKPASEAERIYYAALLLSVGEVRQTEKTLAGIADENSKRLAEALRELIAAVKQEDRKRANQPQLASELLAASYYEQSRASGDASLKTALNFARQAAEKSPEFGFAWERVAELEFSFGHIGRALEALNKSLALSPRNAQALALRGFLLAAQNKTAAALEQFDQAITVDSRLANAWLGRGLTRIRRGDRNEGRSDLLLAAALEPQRAVLRSYLGKAFADAGDRNLSQHELELAKAMDASDPTAWLYSALLNEQENRINEGILELEKSQEINENRRVFRSSLLLDQDRSVRQANLARLYREAGLGDVAVHEAGQAVVVDYANYSSHLFLANAYKEQRAATPFGQRYETPAESEYLLAALLGPADGRLLAQPVTQQEYSRLFESDYFGFNSTTEYLSRGAWQQYGAQYGSFGNSSYALEADYLSDPGQSSNTDIERRMFSAKAKQMLTANDSLFLQVFDSRTEGGDLTQRYNPMNSVPDHRFENKQSPGVLLGYHREWSPNSHTLALGSYIDDTLDTHTPGGGVVLLATDFGDPVFVAPTDVTRDYSRRYTAGSIEAQQIQKFSQHTLVAGARFQYFEEHLVNRDAALPENLSQGIYNGLFPMVPFYFPEEHVQADGSRASIYAQDIWRLGDQLQLFGSATLDFSSLLQNDTAPPLSDERDHHSRFLPAAGILWQPRADTVLRGSWSRDMTGQSLDQDLRLEPAQFAGMPVAFRGVMPDSLIGGVSGEDIEVWQAQGRFRFLDRTYLLAGVRQIASKAHRELGAYNVDFALFDPVASSVGETLRFREQSLEASIRQLLGESFGFGARYEVARNTLDQNYDGINPQFFASPLTQSSSRIEGILHSVELDALAHFRCGFFLQANATWRSQTDLSDSSLGGDLPDQRFWQLNFYAGYRTPMRRFECQVGLLNATDQNYQLHPINVWLEVPRSRTLALRVAFNF